MGGWSGLGQSVEFALNVYLVLSCVSVRNRSSVVGLDGLVVSGKKPRATVCHVCVCGGNGGIRRLFRRVMTTPYKEAALVAFTI